MLNKFVLRHFLLLLIPTAILFWGVILGIMHVKMDERKEVVRSGETANLKLAKQAITYELAMISSDLRILAQYGFSLDGHPSNEGLTADDLRVFSKEKQFYDQIRFLDLQGMEIARVNLNKGLPTIVPKNKLQFKGARYYFTKGIKAPSGSIYISRFDLNKERGKVEIPRKPMLRFVMPSFNRTGEKQGAFVLNYLGQRLIDNFAKAMVSAKGQKMIINDQGYWLLGPSREDEWGFMFNNGKTINALYPKSWEIIKGRVNGQFYDGNGLFTFETVQPDFEFDADKSNQNLVLNDAGSWKLVSFIPEFEYQELIGEITRLLWLISVPIFGAIVVGLWWLTHYKSHRDEVLFELKKAVDGLDEEVHERTKELREEITERKALEVKLRKIAWTDELTGLLSRRAFLEAAEKENDRFIRYGEVYTVLMLDLDHFKNVNDTYGHHAGDVVLEETAKVLKRMVRKTDIVGRIGGEEIAFLLPRTDSDVAYQLAERIRVHLASMVVRCDGLEITVTVSIGVAKVRPGIASFGEVMGLADRALYEAKERGRNQVCIFKSAVSKKL